MKQITLLLATSALLFSCRKTECTLPITNKPTLVGCWFGEYGSSMVFTDSIYSKTNQYFTPYFASSDSVYFLFNSTVKIADFGYEFKNDTLIVHPVNPYPNAPFKYWR